MPSYLMIGQVNYGSGQEQEIQLALFLSTNYIEINYDSQLFSVLPAVHSVTGCDITSKTAFVTDSRKYLTSFGRSSTMCERDIQLAEEYLVKVLEVDGDDSTVVYVHSSHLNLPPTSLTLLPYIKHSSWYNMTLNIFLMNKELY